MELENYDFKMYLKTVQRIELSLRTIYPHLKTHILKTEKSFLIIYVENWKDNFEILKKEFHNKIRFITTMVEIVSERPSNVICELPTLSDKQIANDFSGIPFVRWELKFLIISKFPSYEIIDIDDNAQENQFYIYAKNIKTSEEEKALIDFLKTTNIYKMQINIISKEDEINEFLMRKEEYEKKFQLKYPESANNIRRSEESIYNPSINILPSKMLKSSIFEERDEAFWYDNVSKIYSGEIKKQDIIKSDITSVYIDYSSFNNVNIRNGLILYDKVFIDFPYEKDIITFCKEQNMDKDDFLELCKSGKISLILTQPAFRYDLPFLNEVYENCPNSIISRRLLTSLIIADLVEINENYIFNTIPGLDELADDFAQIMADNSSFSKEFFYNQMLWPQKALRSSFDYFRFGSQMKCANFGINTTIFDLKSLDDQRYSNLDFELMINQDKVHISNALGAFYFPFVDKNYSNSIVTSIMSNKLNSYRNMTKDKIISYSQSVIDSINHSDNIIKPIELIEIDEFPSIIECSLLADSLSAGKHFNSIFSYLNTLTDEERIIKIEEYNKLVRKGLNKKDNIYIDLAKTAAVDVGLIGLSLLFPAASIPLGLFGTAFTTAKIIGNKTGITEKIKDKQEELKNIVTNSKYIEKNEISFLTKISPVARLKKI